MSRPGTLESEHCRDGAHAVCTGAGWHPLRDAAVECPCGCHRGEPVVGVYWSDPLPVNTSGLGPVWCGAEVPDLRDEDVDRPHLCTRPMHYDGLHVAGGHGEEGRHGRPRRLLVHAVWRVEPDPELFAVWEVQP